MTSSATAASLPGGNTVLVEIVDRVAWVTMNRPEDAEDYLFAKLDQLRFLDTEKGREKGVTQFLDDKSYRPGLAAYRRDS